MVICKWEKTMDEFDNRLKHRLFHISASMTQVSSRYSIFTHNKRDLIWSQVINTIINGWNIRIHMGFILFILLASFIFINKFLIHESEIWFQIQFFYIVFCCWIDFSFVISFMMVRGSLTFLHFQMSRMNSQINSNFHLCWRWWWYWQLKESVESISEK